ncbi:MAG TPA: transglutaminase family protein [Acetobacteraceae bacterium]|nr:transglutaminase family protein [Acetobacteraceae bacterium]
MARHEISGPTTAPPYSYAEKVDLSGHMLHLTPRVLPGQRVVAAGLHAAALPSRISEGADHIGNAARWLFLDRPHDRFQVTLEAEIDVAFPAPPPAGAIPPWEQVAEAAGRGGLPAWRDAEFAFASPMAPADPAAGAYAAASFPPGRPVLAGLLELTRRINQDFALKPGETTLHTPVSQVLTSRAGVCQDFTRLMIAGLRALGLPARYVSGYLRTTPPPGGAALRGADLSHAWVGGWMGPEAGWVDLDPTNNLIVHTDHVVLAWGRDYGDISPIRGVILGGGAHSVEVVVDLVPI